MCVSESMENQDHNTEREVDREIDNLLVELAKKPAILQRLTRLDTPTFPIVVQK